MSSLLRAYTLRGHGFDLNCGIRVESSLPIASHCPRLISTSIACLLMRMNLFDLTSSQLKRAAAIKERIEALNNELRNILGVPAGSGAAPKKKRTTSASGKKSVASKPATLPVKPAAKAKKKVFSSATRAKLSTKLKAYWAAKKAGKK